MGPKPRHFILYFIDFSTPCMFIYFSMRSKNGNYFCCNQEIDRNRLLFNPRKQHHWLKLTLYTNWNMLSKNIFQHIVHSCRLSKNFLVYLGRHYREEPRIVWGEFWNFEDFIQELAIYCYLCTVNLNLPAIREIWN